jgi:ethanolamine utilization protein EutP (predicted NTPase)
MSNTKGISSVVQLNSELENRIVTAEKVLGLCKELLGNEQAGDFSTVEDWIAECRKAFSNPAPVSVALLGGTGAGKSTLVNSLIGAQILPTSAIAVCTSSITRVRYSASNEYSAEVELVPFDTWEKQIQLVADDIKASKQGDSEEASYINVSVVPEDEAKRIIAVYGQTAYDEFLVEGDRTKLVESEQIKEAFEKKKIQFSFPTTDELRQEVGRYLTSKDCFWPIVRTCLIEGPFEGFDHGGELVDLPGLNDPNEAREELTKKFLETAKFVWVVFNMKRSLGKELTKVLESRDLLNRLMAGGRLSTMTFVGTHSDDVSTVNPDDVGMTEDSSISEIALARNELAQQELEKNLRTIALSIAVGGNHDEQTKEIVTQLITSPVFMVSASNYLQLSGKIKSKVQVIFDDPYETNIPQLGNHLKSLSIEAGPKANAFTIISSIEEVVAELATRAQGAKTSALFQSQQGDLAKEQFLKDLAQSSQTLHDDSQKSVSRLRRSLQEAVSRFKDGSAIDKAVVGKLVAAKSEKWKHLHWATMRATSSRGGRFTSPTFGEIDLIQDISKPVITKAMMPWTEFFEKDLPSLTLQVTDGLRGAVETYTNTLAALGSGNDDLRALLDELLPDLASDVSESVEASLDIAQKSVITEISRRQQELHSVTESAIVKAMESVFARAAQERGTGMKSRMTTTLEFGSRNAVSTACDVVQARLSDLAGLAMTAVMNGIEPVVKRIDEKSLRIVQMLNEKAPANQTVSIPQIDALLAAIANARSVTSTPIRFTEAEAETVSPSDEVDSGHSGGEQEQTTSLTPIFVDASNIARSPSAPPDINRLELCRLAVLEQFPDHPVVLVADASLPRLVESQSESSQIVLLNSMMSDGRVISVPPGSPGKADKFILKMATSKSGIVISNDSYKEFQGDFPWLFDEGRLYGHTYHEVLGWEFSVRHPVRPRTY